MMVPDEGETRMTVRLPTALAARLRQAAARDRRSVHAELLWLLERGLDTLGGRLMPGPYNTEAEALAGHADDGPSGNLTMLMFAIEDCGVPLGAYDRQIIESLAHEPLSTAVVVAGLIIRAYETGEADAIATRSG
jgi:hypothetical protein